MSITTWIQEKLTEAKRHLASRISMEESWRGGTQKDWAAASRLNGVKIPTQQQRIEQAERQKRISAKCRDEVAMWESVESLDRRANEAEAKGKRVLARLIKAREFLPMDMRAYQEIQEAINELQQ